MSGTGVPEGFRLPWNTTVTMADVWAENPELQKRVSVAPRQPKAKWLKTKAINAGLRAEADRVAERERQKRFVADYQRRHSNLSDSEGAINA